MPYKDPEKKREADRRYREANREKERERSRIYHEKHPEVSRQYYQNNREKILEQRCIYRQENHEKIREWQLAHKEDAKEYAKKYYWEHPEQRREYGRKYHWENRPALLEKLREWRENNQDKRRVYQHNRVARIKGNGGQLPTDIWNVLFEEQDGLCYLCNTPLYSTFDDLPSIDHKIPVSRGGVNTIENVALAHLSCNMKKNNKTVEEFQEYVSERC